MPKKIWRLTVRDEISAGHALRHYEGKCERLHGHNFAVELTVEGDKLTENVELLLDFKVLKRALKEELAALDHQIINEVPPFDRLNPSAISSRTWPAAWLPMKAPAMCASTASASAKRARRPPPIWNWTTSFFRPACHCGPVAAGEAGAPFLPRAPSFLPKTFPLIALTVSVAASKEGIPPPDRAGAGKTGGGQGSPETRAREQHVRPACFPPLAVRGRAVPVAACFCRRSEKAPFSGSFFHALPLPAAAPATKAGPGGAAGILPAARRPPPVQWRFCRGAASAR